jgi:hypothetical protein
LAEALFAPTAIIGDAGIVTPQDTFPEVKVFATGVIVTDPPLTKFALSAFIFLSLSLATIVDAVLAVVALKPSSKSALRLVTKVVDATVNGAVPVAIDDCI